MTDPQTNAPAEEAKRPRARRAAVLSGTTRVRVLSDCAFGLVGEVADIPTDLVAAAKALAQVDDHPSAVAYAEAVAADRRDAEAGQ